MYKYILPYHAVAIYPKILEQAGVKVVCSRRMKNFGTVAWPLFISAYSLGRMTVVRGRQ